jgi:hypothetical protein
MRIVPPTRTGRSKPSGLSHPSRARRMAYALMMLAAPSAVHAQTPPSLICQEEAEFREFDFWVGEWEVFNNLSGARAGMNTIEALHGGCVLVESWAGAGGAGGTSINYYDSVRGTWRQYWVSTNYSIEIEGGLDDEGRMVLVGELHDYRQRVAIPFRGTWTPQPDGSVRQLFEQQNTATGEWQVWFDGRYERRAPG